MVHDHEEALEPDAKATVFSLLVWQVLSAVNNAREFQRCQRWLE